MASVTDDVCSKPVMARTLVRVLPKIVLEIRRVGNSLFVLDLIVFDSRTTGCFLGIK